MANSGSWDVSQMFVLARHLQSDAQALPVKVQHAVTDTIADIVTDGKAASPVDTGYNRDHITSEVEYTPTGARGVAGPEAHYGGYLENGTSRMAPRPYMAPAANAHIPPFEARLLGLI